MLYTLPLLNVIRGITFQNSNDINRLSICLIEMKFDTFQKRGSKIRFRTEADVKLIRIIFLVTKNYDQFCIDLFIKCLYSRLS